MAPKKKRKMRLWCSWRPGKSLHPPGCQSAGGAKELFIKEKRTANSEPEYESTASENQKTATQSLNAKKELAGGSKD